MPQPFTAQRIFRYDQYFHTRSNLIHTRPTPPVLPRTVHNVPHYLYSLDGFGGLVVSMLASGTQVCGFKPSRSHWIFTGVKILSMPSSRGEEKESVPCPSFAACKRT